MSLSPNFSLTNPALPRWAELVRDYDPRSIGIHDVERARKLDEQDIINFVLRCRETSYRAQTGLHEVWRYHENLFHLRFGNRAKQEWQSQIAIPEIRTKILVAKSLIQGALMDSPEYFRVVREAKLFPDERVRFIQQALTVFQEESGLLNAYLEALEEALLLGSGCMALSIEDFVDHRPEIQMPDPMLLQQMAMQAYQQGLPPPPPPPPQLVAVPRVRQRLQWLAKSIWNIFPDPRATDFYRGKFTVEESWADQVDLEDRVAAGTYDHLDDIGDPVRWDANRESRARRNELNEGRNDVGREHLVQEFVGDICDPEGYTVARNWVVTIINERAIVRVGPNQNFKGQSRYIWSTPLPYRGRVWGRPLVDADAHVQVGLQDLFNLFIDDMTFSVLSAFTWDSSKADEPGGVPAFITPGHIYQGPKGFLDKLVFNTNVNQAWPLFNKLEDIGRQSTQIHETMDGTPNSRGRPSATEMQIKSSAGTAYVHNVSRHLERNDLERALQLTHDFVLQYGSDSSDPKLSDLLEEFGGPQVLMDPVARYQLLSGPVRIKVRGLSMLMSREQILPRLMQVLDLTMKIQAPPPQQLTVLYTIITSLGFTPEQLGFPPSPEELMQQMMAAQAGGAAPGNGGVAGSPPAPVPANGPQPPPSSDSLMKQMVGQRQGPPMAA